MTRFQFARRYALRHLLVSIVIAGVSAAFVFGLLYPPPLQAMLGVGLIYLLLLTVDVVCGPLLTLLLANPKKSIRLLWLDLGVIGLVQVLALLYGLHTVWVGRPVVLAFEVDRLVVVTANEIAPEELARAAPDRQHLPWWGLWQFNTREAKTMDESFETFTLGMSGISPAMRPGWWLPWETGLEGMARQAKPVEALLARRPQDAAVLQAAIKASGLPANELRYLPLTCTRTKDWVALLDAQFNMVGYAPIDGFD